jgi:hypothetical protein
MCLKAGLSTPTAVRNHVPPTLPAGSAYPGTQYAKKCSECGRYVYASRIGTLLVWKCKCGREFEQFEISVDGRWAFIGYEAGVAA